MGSDHAKTNTTSIFLVCRFISGPPNPTTLPLATLQAVGLCTRGPAVLHPVNPHIRWVFCVPKQAHQQALMVLNRSPSMGSGRRVRCSQVMMFEMKWRCFPATCHLSGFLLLLLWVSFAPERCRRVPWLSNFDQLRPEKLLRCWGLANRALHVVCAHIYPERVSSPSPRTRTPDISIPMTCRWPRRYVYRASALSQSSRFASSSGAGSSAISNGLGGQLQHREPTGRSEIPRCQGSTHREH